MKLAAPRRRGDRYDAAQVAPPRNLNAIFPYLMKGRNQSLVLYPIDIDAENLLAYVEARKGTPDQISLFEAMMLALIAVLRRRPHMNRYVIGRRLYQRRDVVLSFIAKRSMTDDGEETSVMITITPEDDRAAILAKLRGSIEHAKSGGAKDDDQLVEMLTRLPRSLLRLIVRGLATYDFYRDTPGFLRGLDPLRCTAFVANLGSVGAGAPYHHLYEWGTCSLFVAIGTVGPQVCVGEDGRPTVRRVMPWRVSLDERITDGYYGARSLDLLRQYMLDPALLDDL